MYNKTKRLGGIEIMDNINKIYQAIYSPIITPYNLVDNAKLPNYNYVKYYKNEIGLVVEMECYLEGEGNRIFYYCFDENNFLQEIYMNYNSEKSLVFSRTEEIEKAKTKYYSDKEELIAAI